MYRVYRKSPIMAIGLINKASALEKKTQNPKRFSCGASIKCATNVFLHLGNRVYKIFSCFNLALYKNYQGIWY